MAKPKLCEILGVEPEEKFRIDEKHNEKNIFCVSSVDGRLHVLDDTGTSWSRMFDQEMLEYMINHGVIKHVTLTCNQRFQLQALQEIFGVAILGKDALGLYVQTSKHIKECLTWFTRLPKDSCLTALLTFPGQEINIAEILQRK